MISKDALQLCCGASAFISVAVGIYSIMTKINLDCTFGLLYIRAMEVLVQRDSSVIVSERDVKIVEDYSNGKPKTVIAKEYKLSSRTVEAILNKLRAQFDCRTVTQLAATFLRNGLIK